MEEPLFSEGWSGHDEVNLLNAIEEHGYGNWYDITLLSHFILIGLTLDNGFINQVKVKYNSLDNSLLLLNGLHVDLHHIE
jgi:hypothetical protein